MSHPVRSLILHTETTHQFVPTFFIGQAIWPLWVICKFHTNIMSLYKTYNKNIHMRVIMNSDVSFLMCLFKQKKKYK